MVVSYTATAQPVMLFVPVIPSGGLVSAQLHILIFGPHVEILEREECHTTNACCQPWTVILISGLVCIYLSIFWSRLLHCVILLYCDKLLLL